MNRREFLKSALTLAALAPVTVSSQKPELTATRHPI